MIHNDRQNVFWNPFNVAVDHNLFEIMGYQDDILWGSLSWTGQLLYRELHGRANLGQGALKTEGIDIRTFYSLSIDSKEIIKSFQSSRKDLSKRNILPVSEERNNKDRHALDNIIFDIINLTRGERDAVYEEVVNLVESRLKKANSL